MRFIRPFRRATALALTILLGPSPPAAAAGNDWDRVRQLKPGTPVWVTLSSGERLSGSVVQVGAEDVTLEAGDQDEMIARRLIREVSVVQTGVPWYSFPLVVGAAGVGLAGSYGIGRWLWHACGSSDSDCDDEGIEFGVTAMIAAPVVTTLLAYRGLRRESLKVVYRAPEAGRRAPASELDEMAWKSICRALPPTLACRAEIRTAPGRTPPGGSVPGGQSGQDRKGRSFVPPRRSQQPAR